MRGILALLLFTLSAFAQTNDVRMVGTVRVDLTSVRSWLVTHDGERPMKHWKQIQILECTGHLASWLKCRLSAEDMEKEVFLANAEKAEELLNRMTNCAARLAAMALWITNAEHSLRAETAVVSDYNAINVYNPYAPVAVVPGGASRYVSIQNAKEDLQRLQADYDAMAALVPKVTIDLAMFTGKKYGNLEIWDCGKKLPKQ